MRDINRETELRCVEAEVLRRRLPLRACPRGRVSILAVLQCIAMWCGCGMGGRDGPVLSMFIFFSVWPKTSKLF